MKAMLSSTAIDLPEHRRQAIEACIREDIFPIGMEYIPARDASGVQVSLEMVDQADIYIGIYASRYGWVPEGCDISITEMEFDRALQRKKDGTLKEILIFLMDEEHPVKQRDIEVDAIAQKKLRKLKERASECRIRAKFKSPDDLRGHIIQSLADFKRRSEATAQEKPAQHLHRLNLIPKSPDPYIVHPYSLLQTSAVIGRRAELNLLTDWVTTNTIVSTKVRILAVVALGGMGKSAFTWKWFNDIAPTVVPRMSGRLWWSFYETNADFENFIIHAVSYTCQLSEEHVRKMDPPDREEVLLRQLDATPFILVLDGFERILLAYSRIDAAHMSDDVVDDQTASPIETQRGLAADIGETYVEKHRLRQCTDRRAGAFLQRLARVRASYVLISTRLFPAELETQAAQLLPGCHAKVLTGLTDDDALDLWHAFGASGSREELLPIFQAFGNYPLLLRALAGEVSEFRPAPGDFDRWREANPNFNPAGLPLRNAKTHVMEFALRGLGPAQRQVLHTISAFRMPAKWETLKAILVSGGAFTKSVCRNDRMLDAILRELEDRGLVGWDKAANRYDLHPIVRSVVWASLGQKSRNRLFGKLHTYFDAVPKVSNWQNVKTLGELTPAIELYNALLGMRRPADALTVFFEHLSRATDERLSASRQIIELLTPLATQINESEDGEIHPRDLVDLLGALGRACLYAGELNDAVHYFESAISLGDTSPLLSGPDIYWLSDISNAYRHAGLLHASKAAATRAMALVESFSSVTTIARVVARYGLLLAACGCGAESTTVLQRAMKMAKLRNEIQSIGVVSISIAQHAIWHGDGARARQYAFEALRQVEPVGFERDLIRAARVHGEVELSFGDLTTAKKELERSLDRSRRVGFLEEELPSLAALAECYRREEEREIAREVLDQLWTHVECGPYRLIHADARNTLARIERDDGRLEAAKTAATQAYELAWCDGSPFAYQFGLTNAKDLLSQLGCTEPGLQPFDANKYAPMPEVLLNPNDEFHIDEGTS